MQEEYDLELDRVIKRIDEKKPAIVAVQLPDGLKPVAAKIADAIEKKTEAQVIIWAGSGYGACDLALDAEKVGAEMLIQWGHKEWVY